MEGSSRFIPVSRWNAFHLWPPPGGIRYLIHHSTKNGFDSCIVRVGRRLLVDEEAFFKWLRDKKKK